MDDDKDTIDNIDEAPSVQITLTVVDVTSLRLFLMELMHQDRYNVIRYAPILQRLDDKLKSAMKTEK